MSISQENTIGKGVMESSRFVFSVSAQVWDEIDQEISELGATYSRRLPDRFGRLAASIESLFREENSGLKWKDVIREAHNLIGSLSSFGFPDIALCMSEIEQLLIAAQLNNRREGYRLMIKRVLERSSRLAEIAALRYRNDGSGRT